MRLLNKVSFTICVILASFVLTINANAQCKRYTKKYCLPSLSPYMHNGQLTSAVLNPGDSADVEMTFNAGKEYRILVCNQEQIGNVQFKVLDKTRKILYKSDPEDESPYWDFKVENTQQFIIQLTVPAKKKDVQKTDMMPTGCVSLLVGFKE
ncbi:MAG: hypothetical protein COA97_03115 [Flavobacteriales bacterium]|nr:MAG: hypothetical protein COA97_03115 [Flavobacteriales bacterium]